MKYFQSATTQSKRLIHSLREIFLTVGIALTYDSFVCLSPPLPSLDSKFQHSGTVILGTVERMENRGPAVYEPSTKEFIYPTDKVVTMHVVPRWDSADRDPRAARRFAATRRYTI